MNGILGERDQADAQGIDGGKNSGRILEYKL
jgi:hypothetical protein